MRSDLRLEGRQVYLRPATREDATGRWWQWLNDPRITGLMDKGQEPNTPEKQLAFFENVSTSGRDLVLAICDRATGRHIGTTALHAIDRQEGRAQFGIIVGETEYHGRGIGSESWRLVITYGFDCLALRQIRTMIVPDNAASMHLALSCGFVERERAVGVIRKATRNYDYVLLTLDRDAFERHRATPRNSVSADRSGVRES